MRNRKKQVMWLSDFWSFNFTIRNFNTNRSSRDLLFFESWLILMAYLMTEKHFSKIFACNHILRFSSKVSKPFLLFDDRRLSYFTNFGHIKNGNFWSTTVFKLEVVMEVSATIAVRVVMILILHATLDKIKIKFL